MSEYWSKKERTSWMIILLFGCIAVYAARMSVPNTISVLSKQFQWTKTDAGAVLSSFFWGYATTQILGGYLSDQYGGKLVLTISGIGWSFMTFFLPEIVGFANSMASFWPLTIGRAITGAAQGIHFPSIASLIAQNLHPSQKTFFHGVVVSGPAIGMLLCGSLGSAVLENYGWEYVFRYIGLLGATWVVILRLTPDKGGGKYGNLESPHGSPSKAKNSSPIPWNLLFKNISFWSMLLSHFCEANTFFIIMSWLPTYFDETFKNEGKTWIYNVVPWSVAPFVCIFGGWMVDRLMSRGYSTTFARKLCEVLAQFPKSFILFIICNIDNFWTALLLFTIAMATSAFHNSGVTMNPQDITPQHAGAVFGVMNTVGAMTGFIGVYTVGYILETTHSWKTVFVLTGALNLIGCLAFLIFGTGKPITEQKS